MSIPPRSSSAHHRALPEMSRLNRYRRDERPFGQVWIRWTTVPCPGRAQRPVPHTALVTFPYSCFRSPSPAFSRSVTVSVRPSSRNLMSPSGCVWTCVAAMPPLAAQSTTVTVTQATRARTAESVPRSFAVAQGVSICVLLRHRPRSIPPGVVFVRSATAAVPGDGRQRTAVDPCPEPWRQPWSATLGCHHRLGVELRERITSHRERCLKLSL